MFISGSEDSRIPRNVLGNALRSEVMEEMETRQGDRDWEEFATIHSFIHSKGKFADRDFELGEEKMVSFPVGEKQGQVTAALESRTRI